MEFVLLFFAALASILLIPFVQGFCWGLTLYMYWYWFFLPVFSEMPEITYWQAVGLMLFIGLFKNQNTYRNIPDDEQNKFFAYTFVRPFAALLFGYIVYLVI